MISEKVLQTAADWWAEQITGQKLNWDNGASQNASSKEDRDISMTMFLLGNMTANMAREKITPAQISTFKNSLVRQLKEDYDSCYYPNILLSVDYHPERYLSIAAEEAGIDDFAFPCKTDMWITERSIQVKLGYSADIKTIFRL
jgi:hypothetical protein